MEFSLNIKGGDMRLTKCGNKLYEDFCDAGLTGNELNLYQKYCFEGFVELYYFAPYHWGVINIDKKQIVTYTEGDVYLIVCETNTKLREEVLSYVKFFEEEGDSTSGYGEITEVLKKIGDN